MHLVACLLLCYAMISVSVLPFSPTFSNRWVRFLNLSCLSHLSIYIYIFKKWLQQIPRTTSVIQKSALLGIAKIRRRTLNLPGVSRGLVVENSHSQGVSKRLFLFLLFIFLFFSYINCRLMMIMVN